MKDERLDILLSAYVDGVLAPGEKLELDEQLRSSASARRAFWDHSRMHSVIHEVEQRNALTEPEEIEEHPHPHAWNPVGYLRSHWQRSWWPIAISGVAWIILAAFFAQSMIAQKTAVPRRVFVGELSHELDAVWAGDSEAIAARQPVPLGTLHLQSGTVEIALVNGVLLAVQGPAKFEFHSPDRLALTEGRLSATVLGQAHGFTVETPAAKVVDLGTRFGVQADANGVTEVHVFEGKIDVTFDKVVQKIKAPKRLTENNAVRIDPVKKTVLAFKSDPSRFPQPEHLTDNLLADSSFESGTEPAPDGLPTKFGAWGGDYCCLTSVELGIAPQSGRAMLRFLRGDNTRTNGETHPNSELWQLVDLRTHKKPMSAGRVEAELSCHFNRAAGDIGSGQRFGMNVFAFRGKLGDPDALWARRSTTALGHAHAEMLTDDAPATWQRLDAKMPLPADADFLIVQIYAGSRDGLSAEQPQLSGNYADNAQLRLRFAMQPAKLAKTGTSARPPVTGEEKR